MNKVLSLRRICVAVLALIALWLTASSAGEAAPRIVFTHPPMDIENVAGIEPMGGLSPEDGDHVCARDHLHLLYPFPGTGRAYAYPVYAMAEGELVILTRVQQEYGALAYHMVIQHPWGVSTRYDHVHELSARIEAYLAGAPWVPIGTGMELLIFGELGAPPPLRLAAGEQVGVTHPYGYNVDVAVLDVREYTYFTGHGPRRYPSFMDKARALGLKVHRQPYRGREPRNATCFINYLKPEVGEAWFALLRSDPKDCGRPGWDVNGRLRGAWFNPALDAVPQPLVFEIEYGALSIIPDNFAPKTRVQIGAGSGHPLAALDPHDLYPQLDRPFKIEMDHTPGAKINPDPANVEVRTGTVCYDLPYYVGTELTFNRIFFRLERPRELLIYYDPTPRDCPSCATTFVEDPGAWTTRYVR